MQISPCDCDELFALSEEIDDKIHEMSDEIKKLRSQVQRILYFIEASPILRPSRTIAKTAPLDEEKK